MKLSIPKNKKNKRFNYTPRYYKGKSEGNLYDFENKFVKYRETTNERDFGAQWAEARLSNRHRGNRELNKRVIYIALILIFVFLYIIDFDLSIFTSRR